jgi:nitroimidazol reductase NimA-like FMN-containing flavoprotein (pyridoxamine 5'-phosphate oxidase superfamily)
MSDPRALTPRECLELLPSRPVGRLAFSANAMPDIRPVNFFLHDGSIVIRTSRTGSLARLTGQVVAFEVDDFDAGTRTGWSVVVLGKVQPVTDIDELVTLAGPRHRPWPSGERSRFLRIPIDLVSGRLFELSGADAVERTVAG